METAKNKIKEIVKPYSENEKELKMKNNPSANRLNRVTKA